MIENFLPKKNDKVPIYGNLEFWKKKGLSNNMYLPSLSNIMGLYRNSKHR